MFDLAKFLIFIQLIFLCFFLSNLFLGLLTIILFICNIRCYLLSLVVIPKKNETNSEILNFQE
jgi:hypothetical protein